MNHRYDVDIVIFDCDSTLSAIEGIDELARRKQVYDELAPLTSRAMEGKLKLEEIYGKRLERIRPDRSDIDWLTARYIDALVSDARQVIDTLQQGNKTVHIVSGGIHQAVAGLGQHLGIDKSNVHAVELFHNTDGNYLGFDTASPLARSGGKYDVCRSIISSDKKAVLIGDGVTDLEAAQPGIDFIGFGGVARRQEVQVRARDYITGPGLAPLLERLQ